MSRTIRALSLTAILASYTTSCSSETSISAQVEDNPKNTWESNSDGGCASVQKYTVPGDGPATDIMFIVDNSGSMDNDDGIIRQGEDTEETDLDRVRRAYFSFESEQLPQNSDWLLTIISADPKNKTPYVLGADPWVNPPPTEFPIDEEVFGSDSERPFSAIINHFDPDRENNASTWMRFGAQLEIHVFSDEDDQSVVGVYPLTQPPMSLEVETYVEAVRDLKGERVAMSVTVYKSLSSCTVSSENIADRLIVGSEMIGGNINELCDDPKTWNMLSTPLTNAEGYYEPLELDYYVIEDTIEVYVAGAYTESDKWEFNPDTNTVDFLESDELGAYTPITVRYELDLSRYVDCPLSSTE
jgi:hypothetical protein